MKEYCLRLKKGDDLKREIEELCKIEGIDTACVISSVGSLIALDIRLAKAQEKLHIDDGFEILSLNGTISKGKAHLHIAVSDDKGDCLGGHLLEGTLVDTTCELIILALDAYSSKRTYDEKTGYDEIVFERKDT